MSDERGQSPATDSGLIQTLSFAARVGAVVVLAGPDGTRRPYRVRLDGDTYEFVPAMDVDLSQVSS